MRRRVIPVLLLHKKGLIKSVRFGKYNYIGDPINAVKIFNEKEVDEISVIDIDATADNRTPDFETISKIVSEAFMPVSYGGGVTDISHAAKLLRNGVEKVILNAASCKKPTLIKDISSTFGSQSVVVCIDHKSNLWGSQKVYIQNGRKNTGLDPVVHAQTCEKLGAGEIILQSIRRDGTYLGYDLELIRSVSTQIGIPLVALGGAGKIEDFKQALHCGASAVAAGSMFVYQAKNKGVLINYPRPEILQDLK